MADVTVGDNIVFAPGTTFTKIWRLKNIGTRTWNTDYDLVFLGGDELNAKTVIPLPNYVAPGQTVDLGVGMKSPETPGIFIGRWQLRNGSGVLFEIGNQANGVFWVKIKVSQPKKPLTGVLRMPTAPPIGPAKVDRCLVQGKKTSRPWLVKKSNLS
jgi:hypothetical protein